MFLNPNPKNEHAITKVLDVSLGCLWFMISWGPDGYLYIYQRKNIFLIEIENPYEIEKKLRKMLF